MIGITFVGIALALVMLATAMIVLVPKLRPDKPKRTDKWEKAAIMKQLLALSERQNNVAATAPSVNCGRPP